ncbi:fucose isomerase [Deinococcus oregonensis]|uniref:Fucose isomerase n=1 Tax=Deinococcus oregonensis TaxID=1805970 RepID=A0ABV6B8R3_9DEIO
MTQHPIGSVHRTVYLVANGDLRPAANVQCWPAQARMESQLTAAALQHGAQFIRAHPYDPDAQHGFIDSQRRGMDIFRTIPKEAPLLVAEAVWQYSSHLLAGLRDHQGPILTVGNWSGEWPGLVGLLNLNGSLTKMGVRYSSVWSEDFTDSFFHKCFAQWLSAGVISHDTRHVHALTPGDIQSDAGGLGRQLAAALQDEKAIIGVFDEGCMGMYNAIIDDELLNRVGVYKERLSQSALLAEMALVTDGEAQAAFQFLLDRDMTFHFGTDEVHELTPTQTLGQLSMYIAAVRMADRFGCEAIGIQYQQGLKDMAPASDLAEGLLNDIERPPVFSLHGRELFAGQPVTHFNEVDEGAALDALITARVWNALGYPAISTLHDLRWGEEFGGRFIWVLQISGAVPASHLLGGYAGAHSHRQPPMYFRLGGGTLSGEGRPGIIVWSRIYLQAGTLCADIGLGEVVSLPAAEVQRRSQATTPQWPLINAVFSGITRDQMMAKHQANHIQIAYAPDRPGAAYALQVKAAMLSALGIQVQLCGDVVAEPVTPGVLR